MSVAINNRKSNDLRKKFAIFFVVIGVGAYFYILRLTRTADLVRAVEHNDTAAALSLLADGADANCRAPFSDDEVGAHDMLAGLTARNPKQGPPLLLTAAAAGNTEIVRALLTHGAKPNTCDIFHTSPLIGAARCGDVDAADALLAHHADVNVADRNGRTALSFAARYHQSEVASLLISHGAQINFHTKTGDTPLTDAAKSGNLMIVETLVRAGADVNAQNLEGQTALLLAAGVKNAAIVRLLLEHAADPNLAAKTGETPLQSAARLRNAAAISLLLQRKADPNRANRDGETPLMLLLEAQDQPIVHSLGAPAGSVRMGMTGVGRIVSVTSNSRAATFDEAKHLRFCINILLAHGANINESVLTRAATNADVTTFAMVLQAGTHWNPTGKVAGDLVCAAGLAQTPDNLNLLFSQFAHMNLKVDPRSAIYAAPSMVTHPRVLKWLLDHGADANAHYGPYSALLTAAEWGETESVRLLLAHGAKLDAKYASNVALTKLVQSSSHPENRAAMLRMLKASTAHTNH
jgi:ankyrin repeat protein